ncbi:hypothetical protein TWF506_009158 [Arthrobotrys conoides]|uniref:Uncharacterized protein n=1 Tax=Arthrobotrys conoides TaxID=74498 RepID=A0AAN8RTE4_9PEZI
MSTSTSKPSKQKSKSKSKSPSLPPNPNPPSTNTIKTPLQKILPRDPIEEILRTSTDSQIRTLLKTLCESSLEIKSKAQQLHKKILETPVAPPPGINLADGNYIVIPNKYNPRKRMPWNASTTTSSRSSAGGETTTKEKEKEKEKVHKGQDTYNRMMSSFYQTERNARRKFRFGMFQMGGGGNGDVERRSSSTSGRKSQDYKRPITPTSCPVSPLTKPTEKEYLTRRDTAYACNQSIHASYPRPHSQSQSHYSSVDNYSYNYNYHTDRSRVLEDTYDDDNEVINIGNREWEGGVRLPSINESVFRRRMSYSLELPPILGLEVNVLDAVAEGLGYDYDYAGAVKGLEPGEIRSSITTVGFDGM